MKYDIVIIGGGIKEPDSCRAAVEAGADFVVLCDTNGGCLPAEVAQITAAAKGRLSCNLGIHTHDDCGFGVANAIILEAFVSYLNFGIRNTDVSWGTALSQSQGVLILGNWWWAFFPGMAIALTVIAINFLGDGLRDALDPRQRIESN